MAKEFDIYLNNRLTECDIIVYSIPYRDGMTAMHRMLLESCLQSCLLQKFIAVQTGSSIVSRIDKTIKTCYDRLNYNVGIGADADFFASSIVTPTPCRIELGAKDIEMLENDFISAMDQIVVDASPILTLVKKSLGTGNSTISMDAKLSGLLKWSPVSAQNELLPTAGITDFCGEKIMKAETALTIEAGITNLCYNIANVVDAAIEFTACVLGTELHSPLGHAFGGVAIGGNVNTVSEKFDAVKGVLHTLCTVTESVQRFVSPEKNGVAFKVEADLVLRKTRIIGEMDADLLSKYDASTLDDVDYITLNEGVK